MGTCPLKSLTAVPGRYEQAYNEAGGEEVPMQSGSSWFADYGWHFFPHTPRKGLAGDLVLGPGTGGPPAGPLFRRAAVGSWGYPPAL